MKIRDVKIYVLDAALTEPFAYSQAWYERRGACLVEIVGEDGNSAAIRLGRRIELLDIAWFEEPVPPEDLAGYRARSRRRSKSRSPAAKRSSPAGASGR